MGLQNDGVGVVYHSTGFYFGFGAVEYDYFPVALVHMIPGQDCRILLAQGLRPDQVILEVEQQGHPICVSPHVEQRRCFNDPHGLTLHADLLTNP